LTGFFEMGFAPILVIDDESEMRSALSHALTRNGFSVESAASGMEALVKIKKDPFSLVITDIKMPEMSGMEVLGAVKKLAPGVPVIVITGLWIDPQCGRSHAGRCCGLSFETVFI
jgi:DNA-binding NtrC family response regulator